MEDFSTYYDVLEISETASQEDAVSAYRRLVKEYHPDRLVGVPDHLQKLRRDAEEKWREIQEAWAVIGDPVKRRRYDEALRELRDGPSSQSSSQPQPGPASPPPPQPQPSSTYQAPPRPSQTTSQAPMPPPSGPPSPPGGGGTVSPVPRSGVSRGWSIAVGWIVFFLLLVFGEALEQAAGRNRAQAPVWLAGAISYSLFGAAVLTGVMVTGLLQRKQTRAVVAAILSAVSAVLFFVLLGTGAPAEHPDLRIALPVEDKMLGSSLGYPSGVQWQRSLGDRGAVFTAAHASRIEYPGLIPREGTLEFWIKVESGYGYSDFRLRANQDDALIFSSDAQGGDVTWPGTTKFTVSRSGALSYWMATSKYNKPAPPATEARQTKFRFGEWHALGVSYGSQGQYIMLDGKIVASAPRRTQTFGRAGNHQAPLDIPTVGETVSHFWPRHRVEGGFEGVLGAFRISPSQRDWMVAEGVKGGVPPDAIDAAGRGAPTGGAHQWTELTLGDRKGDFSLDTDRHMYYRNIALRGFVIPAESDGAWVSPASPSGDVLIFSLSKNAQCFLVHLPTLTGGQVLDGAKFAFGLSAAEWTSWSPDGGYGLAAHYYEAHPELFVINTREPAARRVPGIALAKENEEQVLDLASVQWDSPEQFRMRATINCNPYTTDTCNDDTRKKVLRTYDLVINARSLEVSSTPGQGGSPSATVAPSVLIGFSLDRSAVVTFITSMRRHSQVKTPWRLFFCFSLQPVQ